MAKKLKKCNVEGCDTKTHGRECKNHSYERRKKHNSANECKRDSHLKRKYDISLEEFNFLWEIFRGRCGICNREMRRPELRRGQALDVVAVDHCHHTGNLRGLLCNACNKGLGLFRDNPVILGKAKEWVNYVEKTCNN